MPVQTTYLGDLPAGIAGLLEDSRYADIDGGFVAGEDIPFGRVVEFNTSDGKAYLPQSATLGKCLGISLYPVTKEPWTTTATGTTSYGWKAGERIQILRKGRVWAELNGTAPTLAQSYGVLNVAHASTNGSNNAQHRGKVTIAATSATAGAEVDPLPGVAGGAYGFTAVPPPSTAPTGLTLVAVILP